MNVEHFDAVVVGSGFGGSVTAYRLVQAGLRVCLLERGKVYPPGSFPRSPYKMKMNFWDPSEGLYGMYNIWSFRGLGAIVSSGLGGGSLIYGNVLIRKDERWFVKENIHNSGYEYWPVTRADLDPHYDQVETMLDGQEYPFETWPYNQTPRTKAFKSAADQLDLDWFLPKLAVTFGNKGETPVPGEPIHEAQPNMHKHTRYTCRLCSECNIGCNFGSKNSLDYNYLSEAKRLGAEIRPLCEVREFAPRDSGGYTVHYVQHDLEREGHKVDTHDPSILPPRTISADRLILSAGAFGSTFLLLKNQRHFPRISKQLGTRFSGNGDLLTFASKCTEIENGERVPRIIDPSYGTFITSAIRYADSEDGGRGRGFYIEDAGYPDFVNWILQVFDTPRAAGAWSKFARHLIEGWIREIFDEAGSTGDWGNAAKGLVAKLLSEDPETDMGAEVSRLFGESNLSKSLLPLLGMGRDIPDGNMKLQEDKLDVDWRISRSSPYFDRLRDAMKDIAESLGAEFKDDPVWYLGRVITVHQLGGCPMGRNENEGVVDSYGEVFNYPGFYIADGSVMPGPVGTNPSLTIAALANRFADRIVESEL
jgi:cholesterol oxidase